MKMIIFTLAIIDNQILFAMQKSILLFSALFLFTVFAQAQTKVLVPVKKTSKIEAAQKSDTKPGKAKGAQNQADSQAKLEKDQKSLDNLKALHLKNKAKSTPEDRKKMEKIIAKGEKEMAKRRQALSKQRGKH